MILKMMMTSALLIVGSHVVGMEPNQQQLQSHEQTQESFYRDMKLQTPLVLVSIYIIDRETSSIILGKAPGHSGWRTPATYIKTADGNLQNCAARLAASIGIEAYNLKQILTSDAGAGEMAGRKEFFLELGFGTADFSGCSIPKSNSFGNEPGNMSQFKWFNKNELPEIEKPLTKDNLYRVINERFR